MVFPQYNNKRAGESFRLYRRNDPFRNTQLAYHIFQWNSMGSHVRSNGFCLSAHFR